MKFVVPACIILFLTVAVYAWFHPPPTATGGNAGTMDGASFFRINNE